MENKEKVEPIDDTERSPATDPETKETVKEMMPEMAEHEERTREETGTDGSDGSDGKEEQTEKGSQTDTSHVQIELLNKKLGIARSEVSVLKKHNARLESDIDQMVEMLKNSSIETIEVDGEKLHVDEFIAKAKEEAGRKAQTTGCDDDVGPDSETEDTGINPQEALEYPIIRENLRTDMEVLRETLHEAYEREQHYKTLVEQMDTAEAKAQQKWSTFHNGIVQQWSNHCNVLQRQLGFVSIKLRQVTEQVKSDGSEGSLTSSSVDNLEYKYPDDQQQQQGHQQQQVPIIPVNIPEYETSGGMPNPGGMPPMMMQTGGPPQQMPVPYGRPPPLRWSVPDNQKIPCNPHLHPSVAFLPPPDPQACSGRITSARQLHRFFTNLALIEQAQREGRAHPQRVFDDESYPEDDGTAVAHAPRRERAFSTNNHEYDEQDRDNHEYDEQDREQGAVDPEQQQLTNAAATSYTLTPTADPFVPGSTSMIV